jgi:transposase
MWTEEDRQIYRGGGGGYPSDLRHAEWARLEPLIPQASPGGRPRKTDMGGSDERHSLFAAHRLPLALSAARQLSAALDGLQHLSQVPA